MKESTVSTLARRLNCDGNAVRCDPASKSPTCGGGPRLDGAAALVAVLARRAPRLEPIVQPPAGTARGPGRPGIQEGSAGHWARATRNSKIRSPERTAE